MLGIYSSVGFIKVGSGVNLGGGASIEVRKESDGLLADTFSDRAGAVMLPKPFFADGLGRFEFYAEGIEEGYQITVTKGANVEVKNNQPVGTEQEKDTEDILGHHAGATEPAITYPYQFWADTTTTPGLLRQRNAANTDWILIGILDTEGFGLIRNKNKAINGNFDIWQRGVGGFTVAQEFGADRWKHGSGGTFSASRQDFILGQTDVPGEPEFFWRNDTTVAGAATATLIRQRIEGVRTLAGQTATFSFWAKNDSVKNFQILIIQSFGTGGSPAPSGGIVALNASQSIGTTWTKYTFTVSLPSIAGKILGTDDNDYLEMLIQETSSFSTFTLDIAQVQFEKGSIATEFDKRHISVELELCRRYFEKSFHLEVAPIEGNGNFPYVSVNSITSAARRGWIPFTTRKRDLPTITFYKPAGATASGDWQVREGLGAWTDRTPSTNQIFRHGMVLNIISVGALAGEGMSAIGNWTADAEL